MLTSFFHLKHLPVSLYSFRTRTVVLNICKDAIHQTMVLRILALVPFIFSQYLYWAILFSDGPEFFRPSFLEFTQAMPLQLRYIAPSFQIYGSQRQLFMKTSAGAGRNGKIFRMNNIYIYSFRLTKRKKFELGLQKIRT